MSFERAGSAPDWLWPLRPYFRHRARRALCRCHGVPYAHELSWAEERGMRVLESRGELERDYGYALNSLHWHRRAWRT